jgi:RNA polymerase sigma-70 factor (ECF subfamily)
MMTGNRSRSEAIPMLNDPLIHEHAPHAFADDATAEPDVPYLPADGEAVRDDDEGEASAHEARYHENALIAAARSGDQMAFTALVDAHYALVYGLACRTVRDPDEAAEITQDVFLAAWRNLGSFRGEARFSTWLYRITYRRCLQSIEVQQNRLAALRQFTSLHFERIANEWSEMQANIAEQEWCQAIREQIDLLPVKYQAVILLRHFQDLSYEEIAQQLTMPISTVKTHLHRARAMLRDRLQSAPLPNVGAALRDRLPRVELPDVGAALRDRLPRVELPDVGGAIRERIPRVEMPDMGAALRDRWDSLAGAAGDLLRGHISPPALGAEN